MTSEPIEVIILDDPEVDDPQRHPAAAAVGHQQARPAGVRDPGLRGARGWAAGRGEDSGGVGGSAYVGEDRFWNTKIVWKIHSYEKGLNFVYREKWGKLKK